MSEEQGSPAEAPPPPPAPAPAAPKSGMSANTWAMACHLSALSGYLIPFGNIVGPLIVWMVKKDEMPEVDKHGKESLNYQITLSIAVAVAGIISAILMLILIGIVTAMLTGLAWLILGVAFPIIAGLKANEGEDYKYPFSIKFIK